MASATVTKATAYEDSGAACMARVRDSAGNLIAQGTISTVHYAVYNKRTGASVVASTSLTVSSVVFNSLQTDSRWTVDSTGYNFRHNVAASTLSAGDTIYRIEYKFTPTSGEVFHVVFEIHTLNLLGS